MYQEHGRLRKDGGDRKAADQLRCDDRACESGRRRGMSGRSGVPHGDRGAFTALTNVSFDDDAIRAQIEKTHREGEGRLLAAPVKKKCRTARKGSGRVRCGRECSLCGSKGCKIRMIIISVCCGTWTLISAP